MRQQRHLTRRAAIRRITGGLLTMSAMTSSPSKAAEPTARCGMGLVIYCCGIRRRWMQQRSEGFDLFEPANFLDHCRDVGAGGMQARLGVLDDQNAEALRATAATHGMFIEASISPPKDRDDLPRFESEVRSAARAGALAARTVIMPGRRYERFSSYEEFKEFERRGRMMVELAAPVVERYRMPLAIENHKDQLNAERLALLEHIDSEFVGACVDTGNSIALLEDPLVTIRAFAQWAKSVHLKDQLVQPTEDGFLLGDIPLGAGHLNLKAMAEILRGANPHVRFSLELITRDALDVPCMTNDYARTLPDLQNRDISRTRKLSETRTDATAREVQQVSALPAKQQLALEDANVKESIRFARDTLGV